MPIALLPDGDIGLLPDGDIATIGAPTPAETVPWPGNPIPQYSAADYLTAFLGALPRGRAWPKLLESISARVLAGLTPGYVRHNAAAIALVTDAFPANTVNLLSAWQASLGLPDWCDSDPETLAAQQRAVVARFAGSGGQSVSYFISVAAALGYTVTITEFAEWSFGMRFGMPMSGPGWANTWQVNAPGFSVQAFACGATCFGEPFRSWGNTALQCTLRRLAPAHTTLIFSYGG